MEKINYEFDKDQLHNIVAVIEEYDLYLEGDTLEPSVREFVDWYKEEERKRLFEGVRR